MPGVEIIGKAKNPGELAGNPGYSGNRRDDSE